MDDLNPIISRLESEYIKEQKNIEIIQTTLESQKQYADFGGEFHLLKHIKKGDVLPVRLCNFIAEIECEVVKSDGISRVRYFKVSGRLSNGKTLPTVDVPASEFDRLEWLVTSWGAIAQIAVGSRYKDHVVAAIKERSKAKLEQICQHTGWTQFNDQFVYLTASGGIGAKGLNSEARCELQGSLMGFDLPAPVDPASLDIEQVLDEFHKVHEGGLGLILLGSVMRAPLCHFHPATFSVHLQGTTGTFKSAIAGVAQGFFGSSFDYTNLPANWSSTGNALEKIAFLAKDAILVTDDFVARGSRQEVARTHSNAERLFRAQGNHAGRSRLSSKAELRHQFHPRGIILATGEDIPNGHSLQARLVMMNIAKGAIDTSSLGKLQSRVKDGTLAKIMSSYIQWLATEANEGSLAEIIKCSLECDRQNIGRHGHARTQDNLANILTGLRIFLDFCHDGKSITFEVRERFIDLATNTARTLANIQATMDHEASDAQRYLDLLRTALSSGKAHIESSSGGQPHHGRALGWREVETNTFPRAEAMGQHIGWTDQKLIFLHPSSSLSVVKQISSLLDNHLGSSERAISKGLREAGLLVKSEKNRNTAKVKILGARYNVYVMKIEDVLELDEETEKTIGYDSSDIPF